MELTQKTGLTLDLHRRFKKELRGFPRMLRFEGNEMQCAIAERLISRYAKHITISDEGELVTLMSLEAYCSGWLSAFMNGEQFSPGRVLFRMIPEQLLIDYAQRCGIPVVKEESGDVRRMLDSISEQQPQTYFGLLRSTERLGDLPE